MPEECVFCRLLADDGAAEWLWRGASASALLPLRSGSLTPGHTLVISHEHVAGVLDVSADALQAVAFLVQRVARQLRESTGAHGVNVLNASGPDSGQSVDHLHFHVVPRWPDDGLDTWLKGRSTHRLSDGWLDALRSGLST